tara:strand:+ start:292 stop:405 length:114 start_codon:yes stop_codon:yes gene_type:complete
MKTKIMKIFLSVNPSIAFAISISNQIRVKFKNMERIN